MILGVNGIRLMGKRSGVGRCIEAVLRCLGELDHPFREIRVYTPGPLGQDVTLPAIAHNVVLPSSMSPAWWEQFTLLRGHGKLAPLFCPSYVLPLLARCPTLLVHHGSYEGYPSAFDWWTLNKARAIYSLSAWRASTLSTVSESSKRDIVRFYGIRPQRIHVIPEGVDTGLFRPLHDAARLADWRISCFGEDIPFILYVGKPTNRRNLGPLLRAFALLRQEEKIDHRLLLVGTDLPGSFTYRRAIAELGLEGAVSTLGYLDHSEMVAAYNAADLLVYPSSYEGFGMPPLEAMACGTPVVALNNTAIPEFAGGVAHLLKDAQVGTLREGIADVIGDPIRKAEMARRGPERAATYDWKLITKKYLDILLYLA